MTVRLHTFNALARLGNDRIQAVRAGLHDAVAALAQHLPVDNIDVALQLHEGPVYGRTYGPECFTIYVNPSDPELAGWTPDRFRHLCIHELHHTLRWRHLSLNSFSDWTPGEVLVLEGLATRCELFLGYPSYPMLEVDGGLIEPLLEKLAPEVGRPYAEVNWFDQPCDLPNGVVRAAGPMGHHVVGRFLELSGETPISAIGAPWQHIWETALAR